MTNPHCRISSFTLKQPHQILPMSVALASNTEDGVVVHRYQLDAVQLDGSQRNWDATSATYRRARYGWEWKL